MATWGLMPLRTSCQQAVLPSSPNFSAALQKPYIIYAASSSSLQHKLPCQNPLHFVLQYQLGGLLLLWRRLQGSVILLIAKTFCNVLYRRQTLIQFAKTPTPEKPAAAKEADAAKVMADTLSTVPTFTSMLAKMAVVITFCCSCKSEAIVLEPSIPPTQD